MTATPRPRVLLVDDDASIRSFVEMTLEVLDVELASCASVAEAIAELRRGGPADLVITDLMMPGEGGLGLLQRLKDEPALRGGARLAVFSAGLVDKVPEALADFDIWRRIPKPVSIRVLEDCVREALAQPGEASERATSSEGRDVGRDVGRDDQEQRTIDAHFGGEAALFIAYRDQCLRQFPRDVEEGHAALALGDGPRLQRVAHSLKSVLTLLGEDDLSAVARQLEGEAASGDAGVCAASWSRLSLGLAHLVGTPG